MPLSSLSNGVKFVLGISIGIVAVIIVTLFSKNTGVLTGAVACLPAGAYCGGGIEPCCSGTCDPFIEECPAATPNPPPPPSSSAPSSFTYYGCNGICYPGAGSSVAGSFPTMAACELARTETCSITCKDAGCTCVGSSWQGCTVPPMADPNNPPTPEQQLAATCPYSSCNPCTDASPPLQQCTYNGGSQGNAPQMVGRGERCGWLWDQQMGMGTCCTGEYMGALYSTYCDSNLGLKCYDSSNLEIPPGDMTHTGICKTYVEALPQCQLMTENGGSTPYNGESIAIGDICQLSSNSCKYGDPPMQGTMYAICVAGGQCMTPPGGGLPRCVASQCINSNTPLCGSISMTSGPGGTCGIGEQCCTAVGTLSTEDVTCDTSAGYGCMNGTCQQVTCASPSITQCTLRGTSTVWSGQKIPNGEICELSADCCHSPTDTTIISGSTNLECADPNYACVRTSAAEPKRCLQKCTIGTGAGQAPSCGASIGAGATCSTSPTRCCSPVDGVFKDVVIPCNTGLTCDQTTNTCESCISAGNSCTIGSPPPCCGGTAPDNYTCLRQPSGGGKCENTRYVQDCGSDPNNPVCLAEPYVATATNQYGTLQDCKNAWMSVCRASSSSSARSSSSVSSSTSVSSRSSSSSSAPAWCCMTNVPRGYGNCSQVVP